MRQRFECGLEGSKGDRLLDEDLGFEVFKGFMAWQIKH